MLIIVAMLVLTAGAWRLAGINEATMSMPKVNLRTERVVRAWFAETRSNAIRAVVLIHSDDPELKRRLMPQVLSLLNTSMLPAVETYIRSIKGLVEHYTGEVEKDAASASVTARSMRSLLIRVCAAGVLLGVLFSWWITSSIPEPIRQALTFGRRVADGDASVKVRPPAPPAPASC